MGGPTRCATQDSIAEGQDNQLLLQRELSCPPSPMRLPSRSPISQPQIWPENLPATWANVRSTSKRAPRLPHNAPDPRLAAPPSAPRHRAWQWKQICPSSALQCRSYRRPKVWAWSPATLTTVKAPSQPALPAALVGAEVHAANETNRSRWWDGARVSEAGVVRSCVPNVPQGDLARTLAARMRNAEIGACGPTTTFPFASAWCDLVPRASVLTVTLPFGRAQYACMHLLGPYLRATLPRQSRQSSEECSH